MLSHIPKYVGRWEYMFIYPSTWVYGCEFRLYQSTLVFVNGVAVVAAVVVCVGVTAGFVSVH